MRLTQEDMKAGLLHPRRVVRDVVVRHFAESFTHDPDITRQAILGIDQFGWDRYLTWINIFCDLPLSDEASFEWVCDQVERTDDGAPSQNQKGHLATMQAGDRFAPNVLDILRGPQRSLPLWQRQEIQRNAA